MRHIVCRGLATTAKKSLRPDRVVSLERNLPDPRLIWRRQRMYFGTFCVVMGVTLVALIKYEDANTPVVSSTLYTLRRSPLAYEHLGSNIRFCSAMPWISGSPGTAQRTLSFSYMIRGDKQAARVNFSAEKVPGEYRYRTTEWSITPEDGEKINLLGEEFHPFVPRPSESPGFERG